VVASRASHAQITLIWVPAAARHEDQHWRQNGGSGMHVTPMILAERDHAAVGSLRSAGHVLPLHLPVTLAFRRTGRRVRGAS
jgi:hypothetical protein